jgi:hypothetical protein
MQSGSSMFADGMCYTAMSRLRTGRNLRVYAPGPQGPVSEKDYDRKENLFYSSLSCYAIVVLLSLVTASPRMEYTLSVVNEEMNEIIKIVENHLILENLSI